MDGGNQNSVNDDELNQMIANLQGGQAAPPADPSAPAPPPPAAPTDATPPPADPAAPPPAPVPDPAPPPPAAPSAAPAPAVGGTPPAAPPQGSGLDAIKHDALNELRPLVDKLNLPPEDKFDTLLLIIRSTDDASLLPAAHAAAKGIADETRRAQALLDVIKEIDFFGQQR